MSPEQIKELGQVGIGTLIIIVGAIILIYYIRQPRNLNGASEIKYLLNDIHERMTRLEDKVNLAIANTVRVLDRLRKRNDDEPTNGY